jgi:hypothetical protein
MREDSKIRLHVTTKGPMFANNEKLVNRQSGQFCINSNIKYKSEFIQKMREAPKDL